MNQGVSYRVGVAAVDDAQQVVTLVRDVQIILKIYSHIHGFVKRGVCIGPNHANVTRSEVHPAHQIVARVRYIQPIF